MSLDDHIVSDREALAARNVEALPTHADTARALDEALARRPIGEAMKSPYRSFFIASGAIAAAAAVLLCPIPYSHAAGWDVTLRSEGGRVAMIHLKGSADEASRRASALAQKSGSAAIVVPHNERVWGSVYAMAKETLFRIDVNMDGKSDAAVEDEIRAQLGQQGWAPGDIQVQRGDGTSIVQVGADDGEGHQGGAPSEGNGGGGGAGFDGDRTDRHQARARHDGRAGEKRRSNGSLRRGG